MYALLRTVTALAWTGVAILVFLLWRIARFYERSSSQRAYSCLILLSLLLLVAGAAWYIVAVPEFVGLPPADALLFLGGVVLILATQLLRRIMMGKP